METLCFSVNDEVEVREGTQDIKTVLYVTSPYFVLESQLMGPGSPIELLSLPRGPSSMFSTVNLLTAD